METGKKKLALTPEMVEAIEDILNRRKHSVELKIEHGCIRIIDINRKVRI